MKLINQLGEGWIATAQDVDLAVDALDPDNNPFTVLARGDEDYIQTAYEDGNLVVEKREGGAGRHFRAWHMGGGSSFTKDEVRRIFEVYLSRGADPLTVEWKFYSPTPKLNLHGFSPIKAIILVALVGGLWWLTQLLRSVLS